jgi:thiol-disulfide isomerase/thioredoxin
VAQGYGGRVRFVSENYGDSELARRFGVTRYPAIFVDDVLVATPSDFGFYGKGEGDSGGRYAPLKSAASHERLRADLGRMIDLLLAGRKDLARQVAALAAPAAIERLPAVALVDLDGGPIAAADLAGRVVVFEFWATWCPPCRGTLAWLAGLRKRLGDRLAVVAVAIQSDATDVRRIAGEAGAPLAWTMGTPDLVRAFGDVGSVPTLFLFDPEGRPAGAYYGAPTSLHADVEARIETLLSAPAR